MLTRRSAGRSLGGAGQVARKISSLPSALPPVRSAVELKATRVPSPLIEALELWPEAELVIWRSVAVAVSYRKTSSLPSAFSPVRSEVELKATRVPSPLIEGSWLKPAVALVIWVRLAVAASYRKISLLPSALPPVRFAVELKAMRLPSTPSEGPSLEPAVTLVIWVRSAVAVSWRKISALRSALPPVRFPKDRKAMRLPSALIEGDRLKSEGELLTGV